jgi:hypothetical protein
MRERFEAAWAERVQRAHLHRPGDDPTAVLEVLGHVVVRHLVGALDAVPAEEMRQLRSTARAALAEAKARALADPTERDAWRDAVAVAELGLRLLEGRPPGDLQAIPSDVRRPTPRRLASALDGRLDGLSAAACALWYLKHDPSEARLAWSTFQAPEDATDASAPVLVAAAEPAPIRAPDEGRPVTMRTDPDVEAVWFEADRALALYARDEVYVMLTAPGVTTRDLRAGYWLGTVDPAHGPTLDATLTVGDRTLPWRIDLGAG